jgi:hypothetical protein
MNTNCLVQVDYLDGGRLIFPPLTSAPYYHPRYTREQAVHEAKFCAGLDDVDHVQIIEEYKHVKVITNIK